eukprot:GHRR01028044.1.p1 GENE.GHRR01028044.1~~GHRR01028044.1.p1  ORF type:complete len:322 (-),score=20.67 GHRR01028044.1:384-1292(-)
MFMAQDIAITRYTCNEAIKGVLQPSTRAIQASRSAWPTVYTALLTVEVGSAHNYEALPGSACINCQSSSGVRILHVPHGTDQTSSLHGCVINGDHEYTHYNTTKPPCQLNAAQPTQPINHACIYAQLLCACCTCASSSDDGAAGATFAYVKSPAGPWAGSSHGSHWARTHSCFAGQPLSINFASPKLLLSCCWCLLLLCCLFCSSILRICHRQPRACAAAGHQLHSICVASCQMSLSPSTGHQGKRPPSIQPLYGPPNCASTWQQQSVSNSSRTSWLAITVLLVLELRLLHSTDHAQLKTYM